MTSRHYYVSVLLYYNYYIIISLKIVIGCCNCSLTVLTWITIMCGMLPSHGRWNSPFIRSVMVSKLECCNHLEFWTGTLFSSAYWAATLLVVRWSFQQGDLSNVQFWNSDWKVENFPQNLECVCWPRPKYSWTSSIVLWAKEMVVHFEDMFSYIHPSTFCSTPLELRDRLGVGRGGGAEPWQCDSV